MGARAPGTVAANRDMALLLPGGQCSGSKRNWARVVDARASISGAQGDLGLAASPACKSKTLAIKTTC